MNYLHCMACLLLFSGCAVWSPKTLKKEDPFAVFLKNPKLAPVLNNKQYETQVIYTRIDRDAQQQPHFTSWHWNVDSNRYFYPASTVKLPLALMALEKINRLKASGFPRLSSNTPYRLDSVRPFQRVWPIKAGDQSSIAQDVQSIFAISDNEAYNHLFDFLGRAYINKTLREKGYFHTGIVHRFYASQRDQAYTQPIAFWDSGRELLREAEKFDPNSWINSQKGLKKGKAYWQGEQNLIKEPFDFSTKNWFALTDMERMLKAIIFPQSAPPQERFYLSEKDLKMVHRAMGAFPDEFSHQVYDSVAYWDSYVKFLVMGDTKVPQSGQIRLFNKVGEAYGTLTDIAFIIDFETNTEFILAATILCNSDGIFNDDQYEYDAIGFPFLAELGREVLAYERKRVKMVVPDLSYWKKIVAQK